MSNVPQSKRKTSSVEYVYNASLLYHHTLLCAMRLPKRWTFLVAQRTVDEAWALFPPVGTAERKPYIGEAMYRDWVGLIDKEFALLKGVLKADGARYAKYLGEDAAAHLSDAGLQMSFFDLE